MKTASDNTCALIQNSVLKAKHERICKLRADISYYSTKLVRTVRSLDGVWPSLEVFPQSCPELSHTRFAHTVCVCADTTELNACLNMPQVCGPQHGLSPTARSRSQLRYRLSWSRT
eukprot:6181172-Amphidinium_carterae.1